MIPKAGEELVVMAKGEARLAEVVDELGSNSEQFWVVLKHPAPGERAMFRGYADQEGILWIRGSSNDDIAVLLATAALSDC